MIRTENTMNISITDHETKKYYFTLFFMYLWKGLTENDPYIKSLFS